MFWLELDPRNLLTLCIGPDCEHHVLLGHLDDYESFNPKVLGFMKACSSCQRLEPNATWRRRPVCKWTGRPAGCFASLNHELSTINRF